MFSRPDSRGLRQKRHRRIRRNLSGTTARPRLSVFRSGKHIYAQVIDDKAGRTVAAASSIEKPMRDSLKTGADKDAATAVGKLVAERALAAGVVEVVFDRGPYIWNRVRRPRKGTVRGFAFFDGDALLAYTYFSQESLASGHDYDAVVTDFVANSARGYAALFHFYWSQRSVLDTVRMKAGASAPFLALLREPRHDEEPNIDWMLRIVDLPGALAARGYPTRAELDVAIEVRDDVISANNGSWQLSLREGRVMAERGGHPRVSLDIRALAPIFAGYYSASEAALLADIQGERSDIALLDAMFAGPMPGMSDMF